jgi:predicted esterase
LLTEFADMQDNALAEALALSNGAANLVNKRIWISIGNDDQRVSTEAAISFSRAVVRACAAAKVPANVELHMYAQPGHSVPLRAHKDAAQWFFADTGDCPGFP